jgi:hypothetical protein
MTNISKIQIVRKIKERQKELFEEDNILDFGKRGSNEEGVMMLAENIGELSKVTRGIDYYNDYDYHRTLIEIAASAMYLIECLEHYQSIPRAMG